MPVQVTYYGLPCGHGPLGQMAHNQHHSSDVKFRFSDGVIVHPLNQSLGYGSVGMGKFCPSSGRFQPAITSCYF